MKNLDKRSANGWSTPTLLTILTLVVACGSGEPPVGGDLLIRVNRNESCPEGEVLGGSLPNFECMSRDTFLSRYGPRLYDYVYGDDK